MSCVSSLNMVYGPLVMCGITLSTCVYITSMEVSSISGLLLLFNRKVLRNQYYAIIRIPLVSKCMHTCDYMTYCPVP